MNAPQHAAPQTAESLAELFKPLYTYKLPPWWQTTNGMLAIAAASLLLAALLAFGIWRRFFYKPPLTFAQWRNQELAALAVLLEKKHINHKHFFSVATFFLKQFLFKMYGWRVLDKTDDELWSFIETKTEIPASLHPALQELLSYAQLAKFADATVLKEKADEAQSHLAEVTDALMKQELAKHKTK